MRHVCQAPVTMLRRPHQAYAPGLVTKALFHAGHEPPQLLHSAGALMPPLTLIFQQAAQLCGSGQNVLPLAFVAAAHVLLHVFQHLADILRRQFPGGVAPLREPNHAEQHHITIILALELAADVRQRLIMNDAGTELGTPGFGHRALVQHGQVGGHKAFAQFRGGHPSEHRTGHAQLQ